MCERDELKQIREWALRIASRHFSPIAAEIDRDARYPIEALQIIRDQGFFGSLYPGEYGGTGVECLTTVVVTESFAEFCANSAFIIATQGLGSMPLILAGSDEQKTKYLPGLASGSSLAAFALTEPGAGSDAGGIKTRAILHGDQWLLDGQKSFISEGDLADVITVFASTEPDQGHHGISAFLLERSTPGFSVGRIEDKMGCRGSHATELIFNGCRLPRSALLGEPGQGFKIAMETLNHGRPVAGALAVGTAAGALAEAVAYARERVQFGRPIGEFQGIQFMIADMAASVESARLLVHRAARVVDEGDQDAAYWGALAKLFASDMAMKVTIDAVQIFGGYGYVKPTGVERRMRDAKFFQIGEGTNQIQRITIARRLLR